MILDSSIKGDVKSAMTAAKMLQHPTVMYGFSYINWLQMAAEYGGSSQ